MGAHAITTSEADAVVLIAAIDAVLGYPRDGTTTHAIPWEHSEGGEWAVPLDGLDLTSSWLLDALTGLEVVGVLPADWWPA